METKSKSIEKVSKPEATPAHSVAGARQRAVATPQLSSALGVQSAAGNLAVQRMFRSGMLQTMLTVGSPNDPLEGEADRVAEQVIHAKAGPCHCGESCADCQSRKEGMVQRKLTPHSSSATKTDRAVSDSFRDQLGSGNALDSMTRSFFESRFSSDFSDVRVHTGEQAASSAQAINAQAYTVGKDVVFGAGQYNPGITEGKRLLAHELTHVVQQNDESRGYSAISSVPSQFIQRQLTSPQPATPPTASPTTISDEQLTSFLLNQPGVDGVWFLPDLNGLHGCEQSHPRSFQIIRERISQHYSPKIFNWLYENDARILHLVRNSSELRERTNELYNKYSASSQRTAEEEVWRVARGYDFSYTKAIEGYQQAGEVVLRIWEGFLGGKVDTIALGIKQAAEQAQANEEERARLVKERTEIGRQAIGLTVATREVAFWWNDTITLRELLMPEDGTEQENQALAWARLSGKATAILLRQGRYYIYELNKQYKYSDIWEHQVFEEHRTRIVPTAGSSVVTLTTIEGYVLHRTSSQERFFGGEQTRHPSSYLAADLTVLEQQGGELSNEQVLRLFQQITLDIVMSNLADAEQRLGNALDRLYPDHFLSPTAGEALQHNTADLRHYIMVVTELAAHTEGKEPTPSESEEMEEALTAIGRITAEDPTATMMIVNHREASDVRPPKEEDIENRLAGLRPGDAALTAAREIRRHLDNINKVRSYLYAHPDEVLAFAQLHEQVLPRFSPSQQFYLRTQILLHDIGQLAKFLGITLLDLTLLILGIATGGTTALIASGISAAIGGAQTVASFTEAERLSAMSSLDFPGGFQLATPEQVSHVRKWAWIGLAFSVLTVGGFLHSAAQVARIQRVLMSPDLAGVLAGNERTLGQIAKDLGISEKTLLRKLETARGAEREELLSQIRQVAGSKTSPPSSELDIDRLVREGLVDEAALKRNVIGYWKQGGGNSPVKVVSVERGISSEVRGYVTSKKFIEGASPAEMERILGLPSGELTKKGGAVVLELEKIPSETQFGLRGYTQRPGGKAPVPGDIYPPGSGAPQWQLLEDVPARLLKIVKPNEVFRSSI